MTAIAKSVADMILREVKKWDGVINPEELMAVAKMFVPRLAPRIVRRVKDELTHPEKFRRDGNMKYGRT